MGDGGRNEVSMISAQFRIQLPDGLWITDVSEAYPHATFRLLSGNQLDETALELGEVRTDQPEAVAEAIRTHPSISNYELLESTERRLLGKYETSDTDLYAFVHESALTIEFPVDVQDGWYQFDLTGTRAELDQLRAVLDDSPLSYELRSLVHSHSSEELLTDRQQEVLAAAIRHGYFEVPRACTLEELAGTLGVDKSTVSTVLRRGESRVLKWFLAAERRN